MAALESFLGKTNAKERVFFERDPALSYPYVSAETIPTWLLVLLSTLLPWLTILGAQKLCTVVNPLHPLGKERLKPHISFWLGMGMTYFFTEFFKHFVSFPRPHTFDRCDYARYSAALASGNFTSYFAATEPWMKGDISKCSAVVEDCFKSFPSGHASTAFMGLVWLALFLNFALAGLHNNSPWIPIAQKFIVIGLVFEAYYIAMTRVVDYHHNTQDVVGGAVLGTSSAFMAFFFYFSYDAYMTGSSSALDSTAGGGSSVI
eukprot:gb/GEZN01003869.1/.p1 GENE.gb/GEZN01003869.1/~~gb/GEZN01003869.1/.p1  ORF type:complete len:285 (+),score=33.36 gb/GEZN01003869.1/:74-856(+)